MDIPCRQTFKAQDAWTATMLTARAWTLLMLVGTASLAGCLGTDDGDTDPGPVDDLDAGAGNETADPTTLPPLVPSVSADVLNGSAPLRVNLTLSAEGADDNTTWRVDFGDGNTTEGSALPATVDHTFGPGNHTVTATFQRGNETASTNLTVTAAASAAGPVLPEQTHFEFGDSLGCAGDVLGAAGLDCITFTLGPDGNGIDGYWQELGEAYWGLSLTSTVNQGGGPLADSDCVFTDADHAVVGEANNGGGPCVGSIPQGTQWLFIYPYAAPALSMTVDVALP